MEKYLKKIKPKYYWLIAFILTAITYAITFSYMGLLGNGKYIIARSDLKQQYIPFIEYFCSVLRGEHDYWFSWSLNMGTGTALLFAYYTLSPFNLIYLILGEDMALTATAFVIVLKAATAAATFQIFITKYLRKSYYETVLFAMMYALCGFQVCYYFDLMWMDAFYMLPVIGIGIIKLIRERKFMCLLLAYAYVFGVNFYMGYIIGISSFFLLVFCFLFKINCRKLKENIKIIVNYGISVVCALMLTAIIWFPAAIQLFKNIEKSYPSFSMDQCNILFLYNNLFMGQMQTLNGVTPFIYCGLLSAILLPLYIVNRRISKKKRIYVLVSLLWFVCLFLVEPLNKMMHAFDKPEMFGHRFSYVFSFLITTICCEQFIYLRKIKQKTIYILMGFNLAVFIACYILYPIVWNEDFNANTWLALGINILFFALWIYIIRQIQKKKWNVLTYRVVMSFCLMLELGVNAALCMNRMEHTVMKRESYEIWSEIQENTFAKIEKTENKDDFYRILYMNPSNLNQGYIYDYNAVENFNSSEHAAVLNAMEKLGIGRGVHIVRGPGTTPITRSLLDIKYIIGGNRMEWELDSNEYYLTYEKNEQALSLGYMVEEAILNYEFEESPFANQDNLLSMMTGLNIHCFERTGMEMHVESGKYVKTDEATYLFHEEDKEGDSKFNFIADNDGRSFYIYLSQDRYLDSTGGADMPWIETNDVTSTLENTVVLPEFIPARIVQIGTDEKGNYAFSIVLPEELEADYYNKAYFCYYDDSEFQRAYNILREQQWNIKEYKDGYVKGTIDVEKKGIMFTSIPYDEGWTILVNGVETETIPLLDNAFMGIKLEKGSFDIEMFFEPFGGKEGKMVSEITFIMIILANVGAFWVRKKSTRNNENNIVKMKEI